MYWEQKIKEIFHGGTIIQSCELRRFPDDLSGHYVIERNGSFQLIP